MDQKKKLTERGPMYIPTSEDYLHDILGELVEMRQLQERIANALERIVTPPNPKGN